jgi:hypothetical protein
MEFLPDESVHYYQNIYLTFGGEKSWGNCARSEGLVMIYLILKN